MRIIGAAAHILSIVIQSASINSAYCKLTAPVSAIKKDDDGAMMTAVISTKRREALSSLMKQQVSIRDHHMWLINKVEGAFDMFAISAEEEEEDTTETKEEVEEDTIDEEEVDENPSSTAEETTGRRRRAKAKSKKAKEKKELQQCRMDLKKCQDERDTPSMLAVQMGNECILKRHHGQSSGLFNDHDGYEYELFVKNMNDDTFIFSDRPSTVESVESTMKFIDGFDVTFKDGPPNAAVTFTKSSVDDKTDTPLVSVFLEAAYDQDTPPLSVTYRLHQGQSQARVVSLESYFTDGQDEATFDDCSIFIDGFWFFASKDEGEICGYFLWAGGICGDNLECDKNVCVPCSHGSCSNGECASEGCSDCQNPLPGSEFYDPVVLTENKLQVRGCLSGYGAYCC